jgi:hypothetical protein
MDNFNQVLTTVYNNELKTQCSKYNLPDDDLAWSKHTVEEATNQCNGMLE